MSDSHADIRGQKSLKILMMPVVLIILMMAASAATYRYCQSDTDRQVNAAKAELREKTEAFNTEMQKAVELGKKDVRQEMQNTIDGLNVQLAAARMIDANLNVQTAFERAMSAAQVTINKVRAEAADATRTAVDAARAEAAEELSRVRDSAAEELLKTQTEAFADKQKALVEAQMTAEGDKRAALKALQDEHTAELASVRQLADADKKKAVAEAIEAHKPPPYREVTVDEIRSIVCTPFIGHEYCRSFKMIIE